MSDPSFDPFAGLDGITEVTVVGTRLGRTAGSAHLLGEEQLERFNYDDPAQVLASVPGVYMRGEDGMGLRPNIGIRGVNPDRSKKITLMEDGVLFAPAPYSAPAAYYFPLITRITQVKVIKGPGAISYGPGTAGGAIDLVTRPIPSKLSAAADVAGGQYGYGKAHVWGGTSDERTGFLVEGVHLRNNGFKELPSGADTGMTRNEWMTKFSFVVDPRARVRNELQLKLTYSDETSNETYLGLSDADFAANPNQRYAASQLDRMKNHRTAVVLSHVLEPSEHVSLSTSVYRNAFSRVWRKVNGLRSADISSVLQGKDDHSLYFQGILKGETDSSSGSDAIIVGPNDREFVAEGVQSVLHFERKAGKLWHRVEAGLRYHYDRIERRHSESGFLILCGELVPDGGPVVVTAFNEVYTHAVAMHCAYALTFRGLTVTPGLRVELMRYTFDDRAVRQQNSDFAAAVLPGLGLYQGLTESFGLLAGVHRGFSPPAPGGTDKVELELSTNYEAGARLSEGALRAEAIGFFNDYQNLTDICTISSGCTDGADKQFDAGRAHIYGVEVFAQHDLPAGRFTLPLSAAYTYTHAEFRNSFMSEDPIFGNVHKGDHLPYVPEHQLHANAGIEHTRAGGSAGLTYVSRMREVASKADFGDVMSTGRQLVVDVNAWVVVWGPLKLYGDVQNLLDNQVIVSRRPFGARPNAPRWFHVGVRAEY